MIDDKLKEILDTAHSIGKNGHPLNDDLLVAQIKAAFADEGYIQIAPTSQAHIKHANKMTGQEWYERFSDELDSWAATANTGDCNAVLLAAKKASSSEGTSGL